VPTPQDEPQENLSIDSTTLGTNQTVSTVESSTVDDQPDFLELDQNMVPKPVFRTACIKLNMALIINYQYRSKDSYIDFS
jgi:hypothetical protein